MPNRFDEVLDDCLTRVLLYGESVEACLQRYPDYAEELREELEIARMAQAAFAPRASAKDRARAALQAAVEEQPARLPALQPVPVVRAAPSLNGSSPWRHWRSQYLSRKRFEEALDSCITDLVLDGASVGACLERYPDLAAELEPHLAVVARTQQAYTFTPRPEAKARARASLHRALQEELARGMAAPQRFPIASLSPFRRRPAEMRWGSALAAVLLAGLVGSGTVAASNDALPGDTLYPVKNVVEQATIAVQLSAETRAALHLEFATRRADELTQVLSRGQTAGIQPALDNLNGHLDEAARIAVTIKNPDAQAQIKTRAASSASQALSGIQTAVTRSSGSSRDVAEAALATSAGAFANALEGMPSRPTQKQTAAEGTIVLQAANPVPPNLDRVLIRVGAIEAHLASGEWLQLSTDSQLFDLRQADTVLWLLGDFRVPAGTYTQVRLAVQEVTAWAGGRERDVELPSGGLRMVRPFTVVGGEPTIVVLSFEGRSAFTVRTDGRLELRPAVQVQVDEPASREQGAGRRSGQETPTVVPQPVRTTIEGVLDSVNREAVQVKGKTIVVGPFTRIDGVLLAGRQARIEVEAQTDGRLRAIAIEVREPREESDHRERGNNDDRDTAPRAERETPQPTTTPSPSGNRTADGDDRERGSNGQPSVRPGDGRQEEANREREDRREQQERQEQQERERQPPTPTPTPSTIQIEGTISRIGSNQWVVGGRTIDIKASTQIDGDSEVGRTARVRGLLQPDGSIAATSIRVEPRRGREEGEEGRRGRPQQTAASPTPTRTPEPERPRGRDERPEQRTRAAVPSPVPSISAPPLPSPVAAPSPSPAQGSTASRERGQD